MVTTPRSSASKDLSSMFTSSTETAFLTPIYETQNRDLEKEELRRSSRSSKKLPVGVPHCPCDAWRFRLVRLRVQVVQSQFSFKGAFWVLFHKSPRQKSLEKPNRVLDMEKNGAHKKRPQITKKIFLFPPHLHQEACTCHVSAAFW